MEIVEKLFVEASDVIYCNFVEQDANNEALIKLPPVLPHRIAKMDTRAVSNVIQQHRILLERKLTNVDIDSISWDFISLRKAAREEPGFFSTLNRCKTDDMSFRDWWLLTNNKFPLLKGLGGRLAFVFLSTATVESDFSIIFGKTRGPKFLN